MNDRYHDLLRVVEAPLFDRLVTESQNGILHVLFHRDFHGFLSLLEPSFNLANHLYLLVKQKQLLISRYKAKYMMVAKLHELLLSLFLVTFCHIIIEFNVFVV